MLRWGGGELALGSNCADPNCLALTFWVLGSPLFYLFLGLGGFDRCVNSPADRFEEEPPLTDFGHEDL